MHWFSSQLTATAAGGVGPVAGAAPRTSAVVGSRADNAAADDVGQQACLASECKSRCMVGNAMGNAMENAVVAVGAVTAAGRTRRSAEAAAGRMLMGVDTLPAAALGNPASAVVTLRVP